VRTPVDDVLRDEVRRFELRFTCRHCVHFEPEREVCSNGYPTAAHLDVDLTRVSGLEFCKEFELA